MNFKELDNPFIKVTWEDIPENFTQEKIKRVKSYFQNKYNSRNITVLTKASDRNNTEEIDIDIEQNIMDTNYQSKLMEEFVKNNDFDIEIELLKRLDDKVNKKMSDDITVDTKYKKVHVKKIKFSNFLSFGDNNILDFDKQEGITVIDSDPPNFGGKSVLAVDLILFLFFNTTTKTTKAEEIFNKYRNVNEVMVQGEIEIDGRDFIILRKINRRKTKKGDWSVSTTLEFLEKKNDGSLKNFTGEQRRETEKFIKESIGTMNDFLLTVLSTSTNLESLIESKPTERGNVLSRFIGLDILKEKEATCKLIYSEWSKKTISNIYNIEELKNEIKINKEENKKLFKESEENEKILNETKGIIELKTKDKEELLSEKTKDLEIEKINPRIIKEELVDREKELEILNNKLQAFGENEKPNEVDLELLKNSKLEKNYLELDNAKKEITISHLTKDIKNLEEAEICPMCKRELDGINHSEEINKLGTELKKLKETYKVQNIDITTKTSLINQLENIKEVLDEYEKELLRKERVILEKKKKELIIDTIEHKLVKWNNNKQNIKRNIEVDKKIITLNSEIDKLSNTKDIKLKDIQDSKNRISTNESAINESLIKIEKIKNENLVDKIFRTYLTVFGKNGIIKTIMKSVVPKLNNELMRLLTDVTEFMVEIKVNDKNEVEFWMKDNDTTIEKPLSTGSGFEKTLASLAIRAVLTKVSCLPKNNITVFDEVLGKISNDNLEYVGTFFNRIKDYFENIFLITHNPLVREWGDNILTVTKQKNISYLK